MVDNIKIAVLGGDRRQIYALARLARGKRRVSVCGLPRETVCSLCGSEVDFADGVEDALEGASVILLPFPASTDGVRINCPLDTGSVLADVWLDDVTMPVIDSLGDEFLDYVKDGMTVTVKENGIVCVD